MHGILFKFARDALVGPNQYLYGGDRCDDAAARKAMGNELKAAGALFKASVGTPIRVPLMALLDFRGFRLCCQAVVPLSGAQFVYGSADGGKTVHAAENNPQLLESVQLIARRLNIAAHPVREASTNTIKVGVEHHGLLVLLISSSFFFGRRFLSPSTLRFIRPLTVSFIRLTSRV